MMAKAEKTFYAVAPFPLSGAAISPKKKKFGGGEIQKDGKKIISCYVDPRRRKEMEEIEVQHHTGRCSNTKCNFRETT